MAADPNDFAYFKQGEPLPALKGTGGTTTFDYFKQGEPIPALIAAGGGTTYTDAGTATSVFVGSGADAATFADTGSATSILVGSGADAPEYADTGSAISILVGSGADAPEYADTGTGVLLGVGSGSDDGAATYADTGGAVAILIGSGVDAPEYADTGTGVLLGVGSGSDDGAATYADTGGAVAILIGSGVDGAILVDSGTGVLIGVGSGSVLIAFTPASLSRRAWAMGRAERLMQADGTLRHTPLTVSGRGGQTKGTPVNTAMAVNVRSQARSATEQAIADRLAGKAVYFLDMPIGVAAVNADQIIVGSRTFEIQEVVDSTLAVMLTAVCVEE